LGIAEKLFAKNSSGETGWTKGANAWWIETIRLIKKPHK
jgi:hypothetical protein